MTNLLKQELNDLKNKLESIESQLDGQMKELEIREEKWNKMQILVNDIIKNQNEIVTFNVGGKMFATKTDTLLNIKDTLFYKLIVSNKFNLKEEIFIDRSPYLFPYILDYIRFKKINYKRFSKEELEELRKDCEYYEIGDICVYLDDQLKEIDFVNFQSSGSYTYNNQTAGTNSVKDLKDKSLTKGICTNSPGWIIIELNNEWEFNELEVAGWNGNSTLWSKANGAGASIQTSKDKTNWTTVGTIPTNYGDTIQTAKLTRSSGRYIKFNHTSYLGIGYLNIKKIK
jgi:hypothetical protein